MHRSLSCVLCAAVLGMGVGIRDAEIADEGRACWLGDCSKCASCGDCQGLTCGWVTNLLKIDPSQGRYAGHFADGKWGLLSPKENAVLAEEALLTVEKLTKERKLKGERRWNVSVGGLCMQKKEIKDKSLGITNYVVTNNCKKLEAQIKDDFDEKSNQHIDVQKKIEDRKREAEISTQKILYLRNSFKQAAKCDEDVSITLNQAVDKCRNVENTSPNFFDHVYCVKVKDLLENALLDAPFDDKHGKENDQFYVDAVKQYNPFTWNNNGHPDPLHMFISRDGEHMIAVIESGRHRATAMVQSREFPSVPVKFKCRCKDCKEKTQPHLLESLELRPKIQAANPNNMIPLSCYATRATPARRGGC